jgi:hypothetical protein
MLTRTSGSFIHKTHHLQHLSFRFDYRIDTDQNESQLAAMLMRNPLADLLCIGYSGQGQYTPVPLSRTRRVAPWFILEANPGIIKLELTRELDCPHGTPKLFTPTAMEIHRIRTFCPNLRILRLNVDLSAKPSTAEAVFEELARFKEPIELSLHLRLEYVHSKRYKKYCKMCKGLFKSIVKRRKALGLPCQLPFQICFGAMRMDGNSEEEWVKSDCTFWLEKSGKLASSRRSIGKREELDKLSNDELEEKNKEQSLLEWYRDSNGYRSELQRRQRSSDAASAFPEDFMLHNLWA